MITKSYSQSGQDKFVDAILDGKRNGTFLDIGANHPVELSNTYALESELGWRGWLIERDQYCLNLLRAHRTSKVIDADATTYDWKALGESNPVIDYLSLDVDENTTKALENLMPNGISPVFRVLTVETDAYRFGPEVRDKIDRILTLSGYDIICKNVRSSDGMIYETWAVNPASVNMEIAERYRSDGLKWWEILEKGK